jgi:hypothetical protein
MKVKKITRLKRLKRQKQEKLTLRKRKQYLEEIKRLADMLPPMKGHDHLLNMTGLFNLQGPEGVKGYIMAIDAIIKKVEDMKVVFKDGETYGGEIVDLPTLQAKAAIKTGKADAVSPEEELSPEAVAESVNHTISNA